MPGTCLECVHKHLCASYIYFYVQDIFPAAAGSRTDEYKMGRGFGDGWSNFQKHLTSFDLFIKSITRINSVFLPRAFCSSWSQDDGFFECLKSEVCCLLLNSMSSEKKCLRNIVVLGSRQHHQAVSSGVEVRNLYEQLSSQSDLFNSQAWEKKSERAKEMIVMI